MKVASHSNMNLLMQNLNDAEQMKSGQDMMEESLPEGSSWQDGVLSVRQFVVKWRFIIQNSDPRLRACRESTARYIRAEARRKNTS